ncbi:MAG: hypothetical protein ACYCZM_11155 [Acidimicrobiales bacterium]
MARPAGEGDAAAVIKRPAVAGGLLGGLLMIVVMIPVMGAAGMGIKLPARAMAPHRHQRRRSRRSTHSSHSGFVRGGTDLEDTR